MAKPAAAKEELYLYAIVGASCADRFDVSGLDGGEVYAIPAGPVSAAVSRLRNGKLRPERRHLAAHENVLRHLLEKTSVLPMRFGITASCPKAIEKILSRNRQTLLEQLRRVAGKKEMGLRVTWDVPNIFEYFVNTHEDLRAARDRLVGMQRLPTQEDKIELGRMFDQALQRDREAHAAQVEAALSPFCAEIMRVKCRNEYEVMNLACLVAGDSLANFEADVFQAAAMFDNNFAFDYNGPWAPHNFVDVDLAL